MFDLDAVRALLETQSLREPVEVVNQADVVTIDEYPRVTGLYLEPHGSCVGVCGT